MKYIKRYNESVTSSDLPDILKLNLEDNPYFDVIDIGCVYIYSDVQKSIDYYQISIGEIFGDDSMLWQQKYDGIDARDLSGHDIKDKMFDINRKLLSVIAKKYDLSLRDFYVVLNGDRYNRIECKFIIGLI